MRFTVATTALALVLLARVAVAQQAPGLPAGNALSGVSQVLGALVLVLVAIGVLAWLLRRMGPVQGVLGGALRVQGGVMVGPRERLVLVEVGETWLVVGVAAGQVSLVHSMPRPVDAAPAVASGPAGFAEVLRRSLGRRAG